MILGQTLWVHNVVGCGSETKQDTNMQLCTPSLGRAMCTHEYRLECPVGQHVCMYVRMYVCMYVCMYGYGMVMLMAVIAVPMRRRRLTVFSIAFEHRSLCLISPGKGPGVEAVATHNDSTNQFGFFGRPKPLCTVLAVGCR